MGIFTCLIISIVFIGFDDACVPSKKIIPDNGGDPTSGEQCPLRMNCELRLTTGASPAIISLYNNEKKNGVVIDTENDISLLFDGSDGTQLVYDHKRSEGFRLANNISESPEKYVKSLRSLRELPVDETVISAFQIKTAPDEILTAHRRIIQTLEPEMSDFAEYKKTDILSISISLFEELCNIKKHRLHTFFDRKLNLTNSFVNGGLISVISTFRGLSRLMEETQGSIGNLILKPDFDVETIFQAECGSESLALILDQIEQHELPLLQSLRYPTIIYNIIREFNGGLYKGLRGVETLIFHLIQFSLQRVSLEVLLDVLIQVTASIKNTTYSLIVDKIQFLHKVVSTKLSWWKKLSEYFEAFLENKLIINNINICDIVKKHLAGSTFGLAKIVRILHDIRTDFFGAINILFNRLAFFIMTGQAPFYVVRLFPDLKNELNLQQGVPPLLQMARSLKPEIFSALSDKQSFVATIRSIPVLGTLFDGISKALSVVREKRESWVREILRVDSYEIVLNWLKFGMGIEGGEKPAGCVHEMGLWGLDRSGCTCWD